MNISRASLLQTASLFCGLGLLFSACSGHNDFTVKGEVEGADDVSVILEKADFLGQWIVLDSVRTDSKGSFKIEYPATGSPEVYRLSVGGNYAYVPVDSTETVTLKANMKDFAGSWSVTGSANADALSGFEKDLRAYMPHASVADSTTAFKRRVFSRYLQNAKGSVVAYYILTRTPDGRTPLFNPDDKGDLRIFSAVATAFKEHRPDDPRTPMLENTVITARRRANDAAGRKIVYEATEAGLFPIELPDENGRIVSLASVVGKGKPTVLMFGVMNTESTIRANHVLADLLRQRGGDLSIYSVSFDADAGQWRESAANVPWTTVLDHNSTSSAATDYNVPAVPCFYIIDRAGNLVDRTGDINEVGRMVTEHS